MRDRHAARLRRVLELVVTARGPDVPPAILFELADDIAAVHLCNPTQRHGSCQLNCVSLRKDHQPLDLLFPLNSSGAPRAPLAVAETEGSNCKGDRRGAG